MTEEITGAREAFFRGQIQSLHAADPLAQQQLATMPLTLLADLYPSQWRYGPRGAIWRAQLVGIEKLLDASYVKASKEDRADAFQRDLQNTFGILPRLLAQPLISSFGRHVMETVGYPISPDMKWLRGMTAEDDAYLILNHPYWNKFDIWPDVSGWGAALDHFSYISLFLEELSRDNSISAFSIVNCARDSATGRHALEGFCAKWGLPS